MSPGPSHCHYGWLASALGLGLSRLNSHADSSVDERQQSAMDNQYDIDGGGLPKTRLSELLIRESWVRIPPGPPQFCIENWATGRVQTPPSWRLSPICRPAVEAHTRRVDGLHDYWDCPLRRSNIRRSVSANPLGCSISETESFPPSSRADPVGPSR